MTNSYLESEFTGYLNNNTVTNTEWKDLYTKLIYPIEANVEYQENLVEQIFLTSGMLHPNNRNWNENRTENSEKLICSKNKLKDLISCIRKSYNNNKYHCFTHACHVLSNCAKLLIDIISHDNNFTKIEGLALLFSAMIHDVGHLGVTNNTLINEGHPLAIRYSDISVAEMNSLSCGFEILNTFENNILLDHTVEERKKFRFLVVQIVLSTDIADQERKLILTQKYELACINKLKNGKVDLSVEGNRLSMLSLIMRMADVGACVQNSDTCHIMSYRHYLEVRDAYNVNRGIMLNQKQHCLEHIAFMESYTMVLFESLKVTNILSDKLKNEMEENVNKNLNFWLTEGWELIASWYNNTNDTDIAKNINNTKKSDHNGNKEVEE